MKYILFLVESPHKAETLTHILGNEYKVMATVGHMMDLDPTKMSVDIEHDFEPIYIQNTDKHDVISKIKTAAKKAERIIFASDPDREGEMIAWGAAKILGVSDPIRVTYTEITKTAILDALKHPRKLDMALIDAQKTRRILDRVVGYEISPLLVKILSIMHLSAGRVQSVVARLIVDRELEIQSFMNNAISVVFKFDATFKYGKDILNSILCHSFASHNTQSTIEKDGTISKSKKITKQKNVDVDNNDSDDTQEVGQVKLHSLNKSRELMNILCISTFSVTQIDESITTRNPSPPFSTSSLQQTSANKLGFTVKRTMTAAQNLYEGGYITYLRTDSVTLSNDAINDMKKYITNKFGAEYHKATMYKSKGKNTQEAHEAIRPTDVNVIDNLVGKKMGNDELKLYSLIWKRAVASQMQPAKIKQVKIHIGIDKTKDYEFISKSETINFQGFLKVYNIIDIEPSTDDEKVNVVTHVPKVGDKLTIIIATGKQSYARPPSRYTDGSLVNKMKPENLNIGRPATTQSIITKIQERGYVKKCDIDGVEKDVTIIQFDEMKKPHEHVEKIMYGKELNRFVPTDLGMKVTKFLTENFSNVMDYKFTSDMEEELDSIAEGNTKWLDTMKKFYDDFHPIVEKIKVDAKELVKKNKKILGQHPDTKEQIEVTLAKFGPVVKMKQGKKYVYAPIMQPLTMENITLQDAIKLLEYPKYLGIHNGMDVVLQKGRFGYYLKYNGENIAVGDRSDMTLADAIAAITTKEEKYIWSGEDDTNKYRVLDGKFGMYIMVSPIKKTLRKKINVKLPKDVDAKNLTLEIVQDIVSKWKPHKKYRKNTKK